jgi:hypothetical protein
MSLYKLVRYLSYNVLQLEPPYLQHVSTYFAYHVKFDYLSINFII